MSDPGGFGSSSGFGSSYGFATLLLLTLFTFSNQFRKHLAHQFCLRNLHFVLVSFLSKGLALFTHIHDYCNTSVSFRLVDLWDQFCLPSAYSLDSVGFLQDLSFQVCNFPFICVMHYVFACYRSSITFVSDDPNSSFI